MHHVLFLLDSFELLSGVADGFPKRITSLNAFAFMAILNDAESQPVRKDRAPELAAHRVLTDHSAASSSLE